MQVSEVGLPTVRISRIEKSIENHLADEKPEIKDGLCIFRFKPNTSLTEENTNQFKFKNEIWNLAINSNAIIFNLSNVRFVNEVVLGLFDGLNKSLKPNGIKLGFSCIRPEVLESIEIKHLDKLFLIREREEDLILEFKEGLSTVVQPRVLRELSDLKALDEPSRATYEAHSIFQKPKEPKKLPEVVSVDSGERTVTISFPLEVSLHSDDDVKGLSNFKDFVLGLVGDKPEVVMNFANVTSIGNEVIGGLLALNKRGSVNIHGLRPEPLGKLKTMRLHKLLNIVEV